jgi:hypothetical protein
VHNLLIPTVITTFSKEQYEIRTSSTTRELAREKTLYITDILAKQEDHAIDEPIITLEDEKDMARLHKCRDLVVSFVRDEEATGVSEKMTRISANAGVRIALFGFLYLIPIWFYFGTKDVSNAINTFVTITASLALLTGVQLFRRKAT